MANVNSMNLLVWYVVGFHCHMCSDSAV